MWTFHWDTLQQPVADNDCPSCTSLYYYFTLPLLYYLFSYYCKTHLIKNIVVQFETCEHFADSMQVYGRRRHHECSSELQQSSPATQHVVYIQSVSSTDFRRRPPLVPLINGVVDCGRFTMVFPAAGRLWAGAGALCSAQWGVLASHCCSSSVRAE